MHAVEQDSAQADGWVGRVCPQCGLCCNGVLFADVRLIRGDRPLALAAAGLALLKWRGCRAFSQPCACFDGSLCAIYLERPKRCRSFDCHTLKQLQRGEIGMNHALRRVREVRKLAERIRRLLRRLGNHEESVALTHRYRHVMSQPTDLAEGARRFKRRGELMLAMGGLMRRAQADFLGGA